MGIRDTEIKRILLYLKSLDAKVIIKDLDESIAGSWTNDPKHLIYINKKKHKSKTQLIITLLHEAGHLMYHRHNNSPPIPDAYNLPVPMKKKYRKEILEYEKNGIQYMETIYIELNLQLPIWKIRAAQEFDIWFEEFHYINAKYPNKHESSAKRKELIKKHRDNK